MLGLGFGVHIEGSRIKGQFNALVSLGNSIFKLLHGLFGTAS
jgi:hypothetical protein